MSRTNEKRHIKWTETCKCKCRLDASFVIINNFGIMINTDVNTKNWLTKEYVIKKVLWNPRNCECECDKSYNVGEYLDYENCKSRNKLID